MALDGVSTKEALQGGLTSERGFGLSSSLEILTKGLNSNCLIVSRGAELVADRKRIKRKLLKHNDKYSGTLISARIPDTIKKVDIYDYLEK